MKSQHQTNHMDVQQFLAKYPFIRIGRDELDKAREEGPDPRNTWEYLSMPFNNMVLIQQYHADTKNRTWAVALLDDTKAEAHFYREHVEGSVNCKECTRQQEEQGPEWYLFDRDPKPDHLCGDQ